LLKTVKQKRVKKEPNKKRITVNKLKNKEQKQQLKEYYKSY